MSTLTQLLSRWRLFLNDTVAPYSWDDEELTEYANRAIEEICLDCMAIKDRTTATDGTDAVCQITLVQDQTYYDISDKVIAIEKAKVAGEATGMAIKDLEWMEENMGDWETMESGTPRIFIIDGGGDNTIAVYPAPDAAMAGTVINMVVSRLPITELNYADPANSSPEIKQKFQRFIDNGVYMFAFRKHDEDTENGLAQAHQGYFEKDKEKIRWEIIKEQSIGRTPTVGLAFGG